MRSKILFILHLPPPVHGAAVVGKYIHDSRVINEAFDCHYINLTTARDLTDIGKVGIRKLRLFIALLMLIYKEVRQLRPKLVYVTPNACGGAFYKDFIVVQMLKRMGCQVVVHYHNKGISIRQDKWLDNLLYKYFFRNLKVILLADALYDDVMKYVKRDDIFICPNGIPETVDDEPEFQDNEVPYVLFLSNLLIEKGVLVLLDALRILKERHCLFFCDFVGGETAEIDAIRFREEVEKRFLTEFVTYRGKKYGKEKSKAFEKADIFVFFICFETFGLVNLEAMEHKLPIVSTNEGGIPDVVKNGVNGILCKKRDEKELANAIEKLLKDKDLRRNMGQNGYNMFKKQYTLTCFEENFVTILKRLSC